MGKKTNKHYLVYGIGLGLDNDPFKAAKQAAEESIRHFKQKPTISYVFYAGEYDPFKINKGLKSIFRDNEFVGGSAPSIFYDANLYHKGILVISIYSEYIRVGVASADNITKNPYKKGKDVALRALKTIKIDKYVDPYLQFSRMQMGNIRGIMKVPTFMLMLFTRGFQIDKVGREVDILKGISEAVGQYVPIFGGSLGVALEKVFKNEKYDIYTFHSGRVMKDGIVVVMLNSGLIYANTLAHGCEPTEIMGFVQEVALDGYVVKKISGKAPIQWYAEALNMPEDIFRNKIMQYTQEYPIAIPDGEGGYVLRAGGMPYGKTSMSFVAPFTKGTPVVLMKGNDVKMMKASMEIKGDIDKHLGEKIEPALGLGVVCASREIVLKKDTPKELKQLKQTLHLKKAPFAGFYSFGEIGSKPGQLCKFNHLTANIFLLYDKLITDLPK